jgi:hypothetical protein
MFASVLESRHQVPQQMVCGQQAAKLLIRRGAARAIADRTGRTPLDVVMEGAQVRRTY